MFAPKSPERGTVSLKLFFEFLEQLDGVVAVQAQVVLQAGLASHFLNSERASIRDETRARFGLLAARAPENMTRRPNRFYHKGATSWLKPRCTFTWKQNPEKK